MDVGGTMYSLKLLVLVQLPFYPYKSFRQESSRLICCTNISFYFFNLTLPHLNLVNEA